jgi:Eco47II restriction endonuclease
MESRISTWIKIETLVQLLDNVMVIYENGNVQKGRQDPFKAMFDKCIYGYSDQKYIEIEERRRRDKSINNAIGYLHEKILQNCYGWQEYHEHSMDVCKKDKSVYMQIKNKYNTMNSSSVQHLKQKMLELKNIEPNATIVLGVVNDIHENGVNKEFIHGYDSIRKISGRRLYEFVTGDLHAYDDLNCFIKSYLDNSNHRRYRTT